MKHCRAIFNLKEPSFSGVWVGNTVPKTVDFPISIRETLAGILHRRELEGRPRTPHPHPEIQMIHHLHWSGISVIENTVGSSKRMCKVCMRHKKLYEEVSECPDSLVFTPRSSGAESTLIMIGCCQILHRGTRSCRMP
ncbi:hypothetical protein ARMSODRAFT_340001 [Armillaria solidipes]|uniref:Uncharacterized protein n=1 Tax=Armillaria solidipes TaxID=1076256 RepID=A0A2H3B736_9AGAR|nr:hypothetical protein ARMSODRAFT_340001 [Armillaria solidipes]